MKFDPTGLVPLNFSDCWLICYFALAATTAPRTHRPPTHPVEKSAMSAQKASGLGLEPSTVIELAPGGLKIDGMTLQAEELTPALKKRGAKGSTLIVELRVADGVPYKAVDSVLTAARDMPGIKVRLGRLQ